MGGEVFFFSSRRRHTRYWRDWSSDVCSSDLHLGQLPHLLGDALWVHAAEATVGGYSLLNAAEELDQWQVVSPRQGIPRSEERRVGKECRSRWSPDHLKKKKHISIHD